MDTFNHKSVRLRPQSSLRLNRHAGLSLVELMISIAIGLALMAGITSLIAQQSKATTELDRASRQIENGRYATQLLREDLELAGFWGEYYNVPAPSSLYDPCATAIADLITAISLPIQGYDSPASVPSPVSGCLSSADHQPGTDILVVRRADTATIPLASAAAGQPYVQAGLNASSTMDKIIGTGSDTSVFTLKKRDGTAAPLRTYAVHIYFVSPCNVPASGTSCSGSGDDSGNPVPTLKRLELTVTGGVASFTIMPLAEGIENMQLDYGIDADGDGTPDYYTTGTNNNAGVALTAADWGNVVTVRANILARNAERTAGYTDAKTYALGATGSVGPFSDAYKRRVFSEVVRATNPSGRRS
ncbi:PilW family protein [Noviherbaspirillum sp.]|jgi:type IV pilus assembly protein PilW|uniref:PilW family protein n=1 Tax=Noviherbaspirillum sp. TaxID=1926288 RepID=UPI0025D2BCDC|nr:PilW family protein [Noviherbaspirillum sp.]